MDIDERKSKGLLTPEEIKDAVENPDFYTKGCDEHIFFTKGKLIVYALIDKDNPKHYEIQCADYLIETAPTV